MSGLRVLSVALIGREDQPLCVQSYSSNTSPENDLKWQEVAHCSLDYFEEKEAASPSGLQANYLGLLTSMEDYAVFGYVTATRVKIVLSLALVDAVIRDSDVKTVFRAIHNAYIAYLSNPFCPAHKDPPAVQPPITSKAFLSRLRNIANPPLSSA